MSNQKSGKISEFTINQNSSLYVSETGYPKISDDNVSKIIPVIEEALLTLSEKNRSFFPTPVKEEIPKILLEIEKNEDFMNYVSRHNGKIDSLLNPESFKVSGWVDSLSYEPKFDSYWLSVRTEVEKNNGKSLVGILKNEETYQINENGEFVHGREIKQPYDFSDDSWRGEIKIDFDNCEGSITLPSGIMYLVDAEARGGKPVVGKNVDSRLLFEMSLLSGNPGASLGQLEETKIASLGKPVSNEKVRYCIVSSPQGTDEMQIISLPYDGFRTEKLINQLRDGCSHMVQVILGYDLLNANAAMQDANDFNTSRKYDTNLYRVVTPANVSDDDIRSFARVTNVMGDQGGKALKNYLQGARVTKLV